MLLLRQGELVALATFDAERPFRVRTAQGGAQVTGGRFLVRQEPDSTRVVALEGSVRVSPVVWNLPVVGVFALDDWLRYCRFGCIGMGRG
nr:FecR domain-containing protein [Pseudomonas sp. R5(2019)]